jgi:hypothetical protein
MTALDLAWLSGYLDGEGCFSISSYAMAKDKIYRSPSISVCATDEDLVDRAASLMGCRVRLVAGRNTSHKAVYEARLSGTAAIALMLELKPYMGVRRSAAIADVIAKASLRPGVAFGSRCGQAKLSEAAVKDIRQRGASRKFGIQTELGRQYGVSQTVIWNVLNRITWKRVA